MNADLGFGCSRLVGGKTSAESLRLLEAAFDAGIRHFDVARVYGTGDAERLVGSFIKTHPADVTVTTKFGIAPMRNTTSTRALKRVIRAIARQSGAARHLARRHSGRTVHRGLFTPADATESLRASLEALGTERVDYLLLHDCTPTDWNTDGLRSWLQEARAEGRVGAYGISTAWLHARSIIEFTPPPPVAQFEANAIGPLEDELLDVTPGVEVRTFAPLSGVLPMFRHADAESLRMWSRDVDVDLRRESHVASLAILAVMGLPRVQMVLFSSDSEERIRANASLAGTPPYPPEQVAAFVRLVRRIASDQTPDRGLGGPRFSSQGGS